MSTHNIQFHDKIRKFFLNICFLELSELKNEFESAMVNQPSVFELSRLDCMSNNATYDSQCQKTYLRISLRKHAYSNG